MSTKFFHKVGGYALGQPFTGKLTMLCEPSQTEL